MRNRAYVISAFALAGCSPAQDEASNLASNVDVALEQSEAQEIEGRPMWVIAERIDRRTCPSKNCGVVGTLDLREAVTVVETKGEWARVTHFYDANCNGRISGFVESGNAVCAQANGIIDGKFAEWVEATNLSSTRPADTAKTAIADEALVKDSDDFTRYRRAFASAAQKLIADGECSANDFQEMGGFLKSQNHKTDPVYFTYCGGMSAGNRIYLNAKTGQTYR